MVEDLREWVVELNTWASWTGLKWVGHRVFTNRLEENGRQNANER